VEKRITGTKHFVAISWLTGALLIILLLTSCVPYTPKPEFESIRYDGKVYTTFDTPIVVVRSKPIIVNMKTTGDYKYTFNLDGITLVSGTQNTITLKDYNSKLNLEKGFFDGIHTLRIIVDAPGRSEKLDVPIKILNQAPEITITQSDTDLTILTKDPDDDEIIEKNITLYKDGSEVEDIKISEGSNDIRSYSPGKYKIVVKAKDKFEADTTKDYEFQIRSFINNVSYDGNTYTSFTEPITVVRSKAISVNVRDTSRKYYYSYKLDDVVLESSTTDNSITLKNYNSKLRLSEDFFNTQHTLEIIITSGSRTEGLKVPLKINNQLPVVKITKDIENNNIINISITDLDNDTLTKSIKLYKDGKEFGSLTEGNIDTSVYPAGSYKIIAQATDGFSGIVQQEYSFEVEPFIESITYDGTVYSTFSNPITVVRSKAISVNVRDTSRKYYYSYKLDDVVLEASTTDNSITLKNYNSKLRLSEDFFNTQHTLEIIITSGSRAEGLKVPLKINNQNPVISVYTLKKTNSTELILNITDPDGDDFREKTIKLFRDGKEITPVTEGVNDITNYPAGNYSLTVTAIDMYNASSQQNYSFEVQQVSSGNTPPSVRITQPFDGEITPLSVVLKYIGTDPDAGDNLFYDVTVTNDAGTTILSILKTQSTEIVLPNLLSGKYTAIVKVYDVAGANAEDRVSFTVSDKTNYLYVSARDFSSKSLLTILKASNVDKLSTVGSLVYDEPITDFDVVEDYIYAVSGNKLLVIDAKDKSSPTVKGSLSFDSTLSAVRIYKNYAILGVGYDKIEVVDVTDPSSPSIYRTFGSKIFSFTIPKSYNQSKTKLPFSSSIKKRFN